MGLAGSLKRASGKPLWKIDGDRVYVKRHGKAKGVRPWIKVAQIAPGEAVGKSGPFVIQPSDPTCVLVRCTIVKKSCPNRILRWTLTNVVTGRAVMHFIRDESHIRWSDLLLQWENFGTRVHTVTASGKPVANY